ncbi:MAG: ABC transporter substrate-binding protein [Alphaproteobacteria bacterium]
MKKLAQRILSRRGMLAGTAAVGVSLTIPKGVFADGGKLNFYNWDTYIGENTIEDFEKETGVKVQYDLFADNAELFAKMRGGNPGYDIIVPTNDFVETMIEEDMLIALDHSKIPNIANIEEVFMDAAFDPGRKFSLPYMWGTVGIGYRKSAVSKVPDSWADIYASDEYAGRIALMSEPTTTLQMAMKMNGHSINDWTPENIAEAEATILAQKKNIAAFAADNGQDLLLAGEVDLAMEWNGDIQQIAAEDDDISYVVPKEGGLIWQDTMCIPKGAKNIENAHAMINYILDAEVGRDLAEYVEYATPNAAAKKIVDPDYLANPVIFPSAETLARCESSTATTTEEAALIDAAWTRIKAAG